MSREAAIGYALIDAIQGAPLLRSDNEEPRLLVWSANAPEQLGALATQHVEESLRSETARLRALLDERTALLRECEAEFRALAWSGTDYAENPVCPSCYAEWWDADEVESENDRPKHYSDCDLNNVIRRIETTLKETTCDS